MNLLRAFLSNHVFANLTFAIVLIMGIGGYSLMPREQDPEINFNWINVTTPLAGASAEDVEKLVTQPLEDAIRVPVVSSTPHGLWHCARMAGLDARVDGFGMVMAA